MASNTVNIDLRLQATGIKEANKDAASLADNLGTAAKNAKTIAAKTSGAASAGIGETKTARSIGAGAGTGSATSDFAAQVSGLGGLVHVYATFAANLFAISAAWSALSKAMDTTNLVQGLDQIGAASGKNLGSIAKQMVGVADGAISMQQAMSSTAMASAGGMTNQAILRMTEVAKKASLALGRDMPDSMDRITKGIIKTQPELLDELGIMTRVIPAQQKYALEIGKTASSLTDFEKRQAFANAVLDEGEKKFGAISMDANPYTKVLASIQNLMQGGLELMNKALGPLLSMLASSPTGLTIALGAVGAMLLKQAIPAIGMFRENAKRMEEETHARLVRQMDEQSSAAGQSDAQAADSAEKRFQTSKEAIKKINDLPKQFSQDIVGKDVRAALRKGPFDITDEDVAKIKSKQDDLYKTAKSTDDAVKRTRILNEADWMQKKLDGHAQIITMMKQEGDAAVEARIKDTNSFLDHANQQERIAKQLRTKAAVGSVLSTAADNAAVMGPTFAFTQMREEIKKLDAGPISKFAATVRGTMSIATSSVSTALSAFSVWGQAIAVAGIAIGVLDSYLSTSAKESAAYASSIDTLNSSFANVDRTIEVISKKDPLEKMSIDSTQAKANAFNDLSESLSGVLGKFEKLLAVQGAWDASKDWVLGIFGQGNADKLSLSMSSTIVDAIKLMDEGPIKDEYKKAIQSILSTATGTTSSVNLNSIKEINDNVKDLDIPKIHSAGKAIDELTSTTNRKINNAASVLTGFKTALADINKQSAVMSNKLIPVDDTSKMGIELGKAANTLNEALKDPIDSLKALAALSKDTNTLSLLPSGLNIELGAASKQIDDVLFKISSLKAQQSEVGAKLDASKLLLSQPTKGTWNDAADRYAAEQSVKDDAVKLASIKERLKTELDTADILRTKYKDIGVQFAETSFNKLASGFKIALAEASTIAAKGYLDIMKQGGIGTADAEHKINQADISAQMEAVKSQFAIVRSNESLKVSTDLLRLTNERSNLLYEQKVARELGDQDLLRKNTPKLTANYAALEEVGKKLAQITKDPKQLAAEAKNNKSAAGTLDLMKDMPVYMSEVMGYLGSMAKLNAAAGAEEVRAKQAKFVQGVDQQKKEVSAGIKLLEIDKDKLAIAEKISSTYQDNVTSATLIKDEAILAAKYNLETLDFSKAQEAIKTAKSAGLDPTQTTKAQEALNRDMDAAQKKYYQDKDTLEAASAEKARVGILTNETLLKGYALEKLNIETTAATTALDASMQEVNLRVQLGQLTDTQAQKLLDSATYRKVELATEVKIVETAERSVKAIVAAQNELAKITKYNKEHKGSTVSVGLGGRERQVPNQLSTTEAQATLDATVLKAKGDMSGVLAELDAGGAAKALADQTAKNATSWVDGSKKALGDYLGEVEKVGTSAAAIMTKSFKGMEDALTEFVMTGKLDFSSLANSIISDMVRMAIQQSITGPLATAAMSFLPFAKGAPFSTGGVTAMAKGGAYQQGVQAFAKGGTFTNSIVSSPTLFKFAKGTGLMGEAGPEAIMPLKRDANGTLGVRTTAPQASNNVTINIIESKEKAGTQERKNENGVDMISIFVEKVKSAIASDITRGSGVVPGALNRTYGLNRVAGAY